jgi:DNA polymerase/3'-5' exonuclease PolX
MSTTMNSASITEYILKLEKENAESRTKIEQLKKLYKQSEDERVATLEKLNSKLLDDEIRRVGAVLNESSIYETTARTKTHTLNKDIAKHLRELGEMTSDFYKAGAYNTAADIIATLNFEVQNGESLLEIKGIGKGIASKVDQFLAEYFDDSESVASNDPETESDDEDYFVSYNEELAEALDSLAYFEKDFHKAAAYDDAAYAVQHLPFKVTNGDELAKGPRKVKGIGKSIAAKINEFLDTGKIEKLEKLKRSKAVDETHDDYFIESNPVSTNEEIAWHLDKLASSNDNPHKVRAYRKAAEAIRGLDFEVTNGTEISQGPRKIPGIGKSIAAKIDKLIVTGKMN